MPTWKEARADLNAKLKDVRDTAAAYMSDPTDATKKAAYATARAALTTAQQTLDTTSPV